MTDERTVYIVSVVPPRDKVWSPTDGVTGGPIYVYGDEDLKRRQDAADKAGVKLRVRKAPKV
jgi:hypothetical protein